MLQDKEEAKYAHMTLDDKNRVTIMHVTSDDEYESAIDICDVWRIGIDFIHASDISQNYEIPFKYVTSEIEHTESWTYVKLTSRIYVKFTACILC